MVKKVCIYGFSKNAAIFMMPALRYIFGTASFTVFEFDPVLLKGQDENYDVFCIDASLSFYELELAFKMLQSDKGNLPYIACITWDFVPEENIELMVDYKIPIIMFDLQNEEEFSFCRAAVSQKKTYRTKTTYNREGQGTYYRDSMTIYYSLSKNQKCAFLYMMSGKTQKEFQIDFGFKNLSTASTHWNMVLKKFNVENLYKLRRMFR